MCARESFYFSLSFSLSKLGHGNGGKKKEEGKEEEDLITESVFDWIENWHSPVFHTGFLFFPFLTDEIIFFLSVKGNTSAGR